MATTLTMDAMVQQLNTFLAEKEPELPKHTFADILMPRQPEPLLSSRSSIAPSRTSFYEEHPLTLAPSTLCLACQAIFDGRNLSVESLSAFNQPRILDQPQRRVGEIQHHGLDELATRASRGCHLCLTVYLSLDPEALRAFRRSAATSANPMGAGATSSKTKLPTKPIVTGAMGSLGFASVVPIARDQAKLSFRYVKAPKPRLNGDSSTEPSSTGSATSPGSEEFDPLGLGFAPGFSGIGPNFMSRNSSSSSLAPPNGVDTTRNSFSSSNNNKEEEPSLMVELILLNPRYAVEPGVRTIPKSSTSTGSDESFAVAKQWIEDCSFSHMKCSVSDGSAIWKPTHLLDVTIKGPNNTPGVRLVDGVFVDQFAEYVTLSHCWGTNKTVRLHKGTLPAMRQGVARSNLPKTFAEAALAVERLGYRYLWIDALCMMHDSESAVLHEISQMHRIYSEASLNIAASGSREVSAGMIYARNVEALQPCVVEVQGYGIDDGTYKVLRSTVWKDLVDNSPLSKRAWAFQERALAKRTLHFTRTEMLWECQQMCCSEVYPKGLPVTMATLATQESLRNGWGKPIPPEERFNKRTHHTRTSNWNQLVRMYSAGKLSYRSDKLLAIAGLARQYMAKNRLRQSDYAVGLWKPQLPYSLLWKVDRGRRPSKYRAPTWSWASTEGLIECAPGSQISRQTCLEIIDIDVKNKADDPMGLCDSARLRVRGFMARGLLRRTQDYWGQTPCSIRFPQAEVNFDRTSFDDRLPKLSDNVGIMTESLEVYLLPVVDIVERVEGLILNATMKKGEFRRIGTFELAVRDQPNWDKFKSVMKGDPDMSNYEERLDHMNGYWFASDYTYTLTLL